MNRRNFVVGLGTVATISGVASVTSAAFNAQVKPSTNFQIVPEDAQLAVRRLEETIDGDYSNLDDNASWNESEITDFGNVTAKQGSPVVAHVNQTTNGQLGAQLAFNNTNNSGSIKNYDQYTTNNGNYGFFEIANLGNTIEQVAIDLVPFSDNVGTDGIISEDEVYNMFTFLDSANSRQISPVDSGSNPEWPMELTPGEVRNVGLEITITNDVYGAIQDAAGGVFGDTEPSIQLLDRIIVGTDPDTVNTL